ncbi:MAG: hypothetical protein AB1446_01260 [Bacillota bacterium]
MTLPTAHAVPGRTARENNQPPTARITNRPPTAVECVQTTKVFDQCTFQETRSQCFPIPEDPCGPFPLPLGSTATLRVTGVSCRILDAVPAPPPHGPGFKVLTVLVTVTLEIIVLNQYGLERCRFPATFALVRNVVLYAPDGTDPSCEVLWCEGTWCLVVDGVQPQVCCEIDLCVQVEVAGRVRLLIPVAGFCEPRIM